jgi:aryl-phospho-beta-D-glucosidase BglC (GH1 family)
VGLAGPVGPASLYNQSTGALFAPRLSALDSAIDWVLACGLDVLVDLHFVSDSDKSRVLADPTAFSIYCAFAGNLAQHLTSSRPLPRIALELFNEPHTTSNASAPACPQLQNMLYSSDVQVLACSLSLLATTSAAPLDFPG